MLGFITLGTNDSVAVSRFYDSLIVEINVKQPSMSAPHCVPHSSERSLS